MNDIRPIRSYCGTPSLLLAAALLAAAGCNNSDATPITTGFITLQQGAPEVPYWDDAHDVLYIVDNTGNRVWKWTDELGANALAFTQPWASLALPSGATTLASNVTLGQATALPDGTFVVNRFGTPGGTASGGIAYVKPDGASALVPNLDGTRHRLGLAYDAAGGTLYGSYFGSTGAVTTIDIHSGETDLSTGFGKIVGLVVASGKLYVSDQTAGKVFYAPLSSIPATIDGWSTLATLVKPDQICAGPNGSIFSGQFQSDGTSSAPLAVRRDRLRRRGHLLHARHPRPGHLQAERRLLRPDSQAPVRDRLRGHGAHRRPHFPRPVACTRRLGLAAAAAPSSRPRLSQKLTASKGATPMSTYRAFAAAFLPALLLIGCGKSSSPTSTPAAVALNQPLPSVSFMAADGSSTSLSSYSETSQAQPHLLMIRLVAGWCGTCQWHAANTSSMLPSGMKDRVRVLDVVLAGQDNGPPVQADITAWATLGDGTATVVADPSFQLAGLFPSRAALPYVALVDSRTLTPWTALVNPEPDAVTNAVQAAVARLDGTSAPAPVSSALYDGLFTRKQWDLIRAMALPSAPTSDPTNKYESVPEVIAFGQTLFSDGDLSPSSKKVSCSSCHPSNMLFQDGKDQPPEGVGSLGRNAPTLLLTSEQRWHFWDGRADSSWSQATMPIEADVEMGSSRLYVAHVIHDKHQATYEALFGALPPLTDATRFPAAGMPGTAAWQGMTDADRIAVNRVFANVGKSLAAYERSLFPLPSALDQYAAGSVNALTSDEKAGLQAFFTAGCAQCHHGPRLSDGSFHVLRFPTGNPDRTPDNGRIDGIPALLAGDFLKSSLYSDAPTAPLSVSSGPGLLGAFKTPMLRGVAFTAPYGHGGTYGGLGATIQAHQQGGLPASSPYAVGTTEPWVPEFDTVLIPQIETFLQTLRLDLPAQ